MKEDEKRTEGRKKREEGERLEVYYGPAGKGESGVHTLELGEQSRRRLEDGDKCYYGDGDASGHETLGSHVHQKGHWRCVRWWWLGGHLHEDRNLSGQSGWDGGGKIARLLTASQVTEWIQKPQATTVHYDLVDHRMDHESWDHLGTVLYGSLG